MKLVNQTANYLDTANWELETLKSELALKRAEVRSLRREVVAGWIAGIVLGVFGTFAVLGW